MRQIKNLFSISLLFLATTLPAKTITVSPEVDFLDSDSLSDTIKTQRATVQNDIHWLRQDSSIINKKCFFHSAKTDVTWAGVPWIVAGALARRERENIRELTHKFQYNFHNTADNYLQYSPLILTTGLKIAGVQGRSSWGRYAVSVAASYAVMAAMVNSIKYTVKEKRPDGSTSNSFPSGHTATAFAAATILHKEYGMTRSPWYSIGGYMLATATGCMRILNNRHWLSDVFAGAGIGILSTELGYTLADLIFKRKGIVRSDRKERPIFGKQPSFFNIQMGIGLGSQRLNLLENNPKLRKDYEDYKVRELKLPHAFSVGAEGAYFINKYIGVGGQLRVVSRNVKNWNDFTQCQLHEERYKRLPNYEGFINDYYAYVQSDHLAEFSLSGGLYFNLPISDRWSIGTKLLLGRSYMQGIDIRANVNGHQRDLDFSYDAYGNRQRVVVDIKGGKGDNGQPYNISWDYLKVNGHKAFVVGTGISINFAYKSLIAWRAFCDYDFTNRTYSIEYAPTYFLKDAARSITFAGKPTKEAEKLFAPTITKRRNALNNVIIGGAFSISF